MVKKNGDVLRYGQNSFPHLGRVAKNACDQINQNAEGCCLAAMKQNISGGVVCAIRKFDHMAGVHYNRQRGYAVGS